jgi:MarR family transcriptional regulator, organic hydroperoxide resistance regulator
MNINDCIFFLLTKCSQTGVKFWAQKVSSLGVTAVQAMVLGFLSEEDMITSRQLGERTIIDSATLAGILDRLETMGYVERKSNPDDRRSIMISLTVAGKEVALKIRNLLDNANQEFLQKLSKEENAMLRGLLRRLK